MKLIDYKYPHCGGEIHIAEGRTEALVRRTEILRLKYVK